MKKVLLFGNPNVGKSVVFTRLTGVQTMSANYPGTTVTFSRGQMKLGDEIAEVIDVPGSYTLEPTCEAEIVARRMLDEVAADKEGEVIILNVVDATNLERNLYLTQQLLERGLPTVIAMNMWDETRHKGIKIELDRLSEILGVPIAPTSATSGEGIKQLVVQLLSPQIPSLAVQGQDERWQRIGGIIHQVQQITHRHHTLGERLADASVSPVLGVFMAMLIMAAVFMVVRFVGEGLISYVFDPIFDNLWAPVVHSLSDALGGSGFLHGLLVGNVSGGEINFKESLGLLTSGLYVPFAMVLPYIVAFYLVLGILEDTGYLPRLAVLLDNVMHHLGLHGFAFIPTLLGLGCNVPAIMATRSLESRRERFIAATLVSVAVPCVSLQAMIIGMLGGFGVEYVFLVFGTLFAVWLGLGMILNKITPGFSPELLLEVPPYRLPPVNLVFKKLAFRIKSFLKEALPIILGVVAVINILNFTKVFDVIAKVAEPVVTGILGLPAEAAVPLVVGFLRKDAAMALMGPLDMGPEQLVVASLVLAMLFPCIASLVILFRELGKRDALKSVLVMLIAAFGVGGLMNLIL
ncbi:ferrous iron transporter B [Dehalococcoides mccartyi]|uniref:Ferrous iron transport protein B, putative n=1 Tax=Dehalococcoides mccartyi (strain ATCC BAA-2266 / KCTC 15142 / 195) TaxID=243164 RepID=Q3Z6E6_DEHM1|nr:ferrous iron transporter B [Dehalococcoides mccartyi]AAW39294.1 ferrous iron transport protein B, putative [Dehalococcoides mccartyi 195]